MSSTGLSACRPSDVAAAALTPATDECKSPESAEHERIGFGFRNGRPEGNEVRALPVVVPLHPADVVSKPIRCRCRVRLCIGVQNQLPR